MKDDNLMRHLLKQMLIKLWPYLLIYIPLINKFKGLNRRIYMAQLHQNDIFKWREETARELGVKIGKNCRFYSINFFSEPYLIEIGDNVIVSGEVIFITHDGGIYLFKDEDPDLYGHFGRIKIGNNCFIGMGALIMPNVEIGNNCIVGAGSLIMDSFPDNSVILGNPARRVFDISMYKKMRLNSKLTLRDHDFAYPKHDDMPRDKKEPLLLDLIARHPIRKPRRHNK